MPDFVIRSINITAITSTYLVSGTTVQWLNLMVSIPKASRYVRPLSDIGPRNQLLLTDSLFPEEIRVLISRSVKMRGSANYLKECDPGNPQSRYILCVISIVNTDLAPVYKAEKQSVSVVMVE